MQNLPIDQTRAGSFNALRVMPDIDDNGAQKDNRDGVPMWKVETLFRPAPTPGAQREPQSSVETVKIAAHTQPKITEMQAVTFEGLTARMWSMNGRSGISLSADGIANTRGGGSE